jgi:RimJ/RimL family protein N-acetyltransferase
MPHPIPTLQTPRLLLQPLDQNDADQLQSIFPQWEIVRFLASHIPWPYPADGALTHIRDKALPAMEQGVEWNWSLRPKSEPVRLIGVISLMEQADNNRGFWLDPVWQGQGLMTEACVAVTDYWFDVLKRPVLRAPKAAANIRSRRLSERMGMRHIKTVEYDYVSGRLPCEVWEITREEWQESRLRFAAKS